MPTPSEVIAASRVDACAGDAEQDLACELLYRFFAATFSDPRSAVRGAVIDAHSQEVVIEAADFLRSMHAGCGPCLGFGELPADELDLRPVMRHIQLGDAGDAEYVRVFGLVSCRECPPYETEYDPLEDTFFRSQQMADIAGFYRAFGLVPSAELSERPDHLALELEFNALVLAKKRLALEAAKNSHSPERAAICQEAREKFVREHFGWWTPSFSVALRKKAGAGIYDDLGRALGAFVAIERRRLGIPPQLGRVRPCPAERPEEPDGCLVQLSGLPPAGNSADRSDE